MSTGGAYPEPTQNDSEFQRDLAIAEVTARHHKRTSIWTACIAVGAALLSSLLTIAGGQLQSQHSQRQYLLESKKEAYSQIYESLRILESDTDSFAGQLYTRTRARTISLSTEEVVKETTTLLAQWETDVKAVHKASGDLRLLADQSIIELATKCSSTLTGRQNELLKVIDDLGIDINTGNKELYDYLDHADSALYGPECVTYTDAAKKDLAG